MYLSPGDARTLGVAVDRLIPPSGAHPGAAALGAVDYIDGLLGAFASDPPRIFAGGPFSGRQGGEAQFLLVRLFLGAQINATELFAFLLEFLDLLFG